MDKKKSVKDNDKKDSQTVSKSDQKNIQSIWVISR